ncbi:prolyl oligopeptidase family serine peptidase [Caballeronia sp. LZ008]|uniref:alpha/beta hydrolase family protein n=1 Tax=unclassified Caballeronia TaxID=2646786 RepID=UPI002027FA1A|nr:MULTISPECIES: prolyl oligopeptidase family serine peptidase [unclassified Caballeronia]MDR5795083.1 prolyl oligopeptidase family serine peptidase [Caballeronia sp. LZ008]
MLTSNPSPRSLSLDDVLAFESLDGSHIPILDVSPDRKRIAVSVTAGLAGLPSSTRPFLWGADRGRLHIIDVETGSARIVSGPDGAGITSPYWSPSGKRIAAIAAHRDWVRLCIVDPDSVSVETIADRDVAMEFEGQPSLRWVDDDTLSVLVVPAGRRAAGIESARSTIEAAPKAWAAMQVGQHSTGNRLTVKQGGRKRPPHEQVTVSLVDRSISTVTEPNTAHPGVAALASDETTSSHPDVIDTAMRPTDRQLWHDKATDERMVVARGNTGAELLWLRGHERWRTILRINGHLAGVRIGRAFEVQYELPGGRVTTMRCVLPPDWREGDRRPAVMFVYPTLDRAANPDAPLLVEGPTFIYNAHLFAAQGYVVLDPDLPFDENTDGDLIDAVATGAGRALDAAERAGIIDRDCVHVFGQSAGGWAVMALLAKTRHFCSGISLAGVSDLIALHGQLDPRWRYESRHQAEFHFADMCEDFFHLSRPPWQDPASYMRNSPILFADKIEAPLLLMHGDLDYVSIAQSEAMFVALSRQGKPVEFVRYWGEDHVYASPANIRDAFGRIVAWTQHHSAR